MKIDLDGHKRRREAFETADRRRALLESHAAVMSCAKHAERTALAAHDAARLTLECYLSMISPQFASAMRLSLDESSNSK